MDNKPAIIITGGSGLIGSVLIDRFKQANELFVLDVKPPKEMDPTVHYVETDFTEDESVHASLEVVKGRAGRIASVFHLAAHYDFSGEPSPLYEELTVRGTERLLDGLEGWEVEQFIFSSTVLVMEPSDEKKISELSATRGEWAYPKSKLKAESAIKAHRSNFSKLIYRVAGAYDGWCHSLPLSQQIRRIYEKDFESRFFPGDSSKGQPFIHLQDLASAFGAAFDRRKELPRLEDYLISEPEVMSYADLQSVIGERLHGKEWATIRVPKSVAKVGAKAKGMLSSEASFIKPWMVDIADDHYPVVVDKARGQLGWEPEFRLHIAVHTILENLLEDPIRWYQENDLGEPPTEGRNNYFVRPAGLTGSRSFL